MAPHRHADITTHGLSLLSVTPMRREAGERSEMVSQLLFGEWYRVIEERGGWLYIASGMDGYEGWIDSRLFYGISGSCYEALVSDPPPVVASAFVTAVPAVGEGRFFAPESLAAQRPVFLPAGSRLHGWNPDSRAFHVDSMVFSLKGRGGKIIRPRTSLAGIVTTARLFLHTPYLWGGRTVMGCDCSGFIQTVYALHGYRLPRDVSQQAECGAAVDSRAAVRCGDLGFFSRGTSGVSHVGMFISPHRIIHSSGWVRIETVDDEGIQTGTGRECSHRLCFIRRIAG